MCIVTYCKNMNPNLRIICHRRRRHGFRDFWVSKNKVQNHWIITLEKKNQNMHFFFFCYFLKRVLNLITAFIYKMAIERFENLENNAYIFFDIIFLSLLLCKQHRFEEVKFKNRLFISTYLLNKIYFAHLQGSVTFNHLSF